jgi:hypothetical protein
VGVALACAVVLFGLGTGSAAAANWAVLRVPPKQLEHGSTDSVPLFGVSCPGESLCVAVGALGTVAVSRSPAGGAEEWEVFYPTFAEPDKSCLEEGISAERCAEPRGSLDAVSCATESLCVAVGKEGAVYSSTDPAGGAKAWTVGNGKELGSPHLTAVSCPSASLCVAVSGERGAAVGRIVTSTAPASGQWQSAELAGAPDLRAVSCATTTLCVAAGAGGQIFVSIDPSGGASAWREVASPTPRELRAVSCVTGLCAAGDAGGNILTSTDPAAAGRFTEADGGGSIQITGASCPSAERCVAVDENGDVLTSTEPTGGSGAWTFQNLVPFEAESPDRGQFVGNALWGASCASPSLCVLVGAESRIFTATAPFSAPAVSPSAGGGGTTGKKASLRPRTHLVFAEGFWKGTSTRRRHAKARFHFYSREGASGFVCKRDRGKWRRCHSPLRYWVKPGRHVLRVRAIGPTDLRGPVAALPFRVVRFHHH